MPNVLNRILAMSTEDRVALTMSNSHMSTDDMSTSDVTPVMPTGFTLADVIRKQARLRPNSAAVTFGDVTLSFAEIDQRSSRAANAMIAAGVGKGDRVAVLSKNAPVFFELAFAASKAGAVLAGLNWRLAPIEIEAIMADAEPTVALVADEERALLTETALAMPSLKVVIGLDQGYEEWITGASEVDPGVSCATEDVVLLLYTSGTTGVPKGAQLTNANMWFGERLARETWGFTETSVNLVGMPMFHIGGIGYGMSALIVGGHTVLLRVADPAAIIGAIEKHRVTHAFFVPAVVQTIVSAPGVEDADLSSMQLLSYGASPIGDAVLRRAISVVGCQFTQSYGMTETAGTIVSLPPSDHLPDDPERSALLRSCGKALPWIELALFDPTTGERVPTGTVGEIWVRSAMNMVGYRNKPEETARTITADGWLRTGDAAYANEDGYLFLFDRFKDMIVSGGENIYPAEVENSLYDHPAIAEVAVIGVPHERWGESPKAMIVLRPGMSATPEELIEFARTKLARYKCPSSIDFVEALPRNASGKILKKDLRAPFWIGLDRAIS
jgi:acyl-CoA synthetase (AMP-forming)/AMP-acid ligase II